jgi:DNA-3-methyladenine glycosylase II
MSLTPGYWKRACTELTENDPVLGKIIASYEGEMLKSRGEPFVSLARSIVGQQISVKASETIWLRLMALLNDDMSPKTILSTPADGLRGVGLSNQKVGYINGIAEYFNNTPPTFAHFQTMSDAEVLTELTSLKGIGGWTAEMFLIFCLVRPDIFPVDDIGLQKAIKKHYDCNEKKAMLMLSNRWSPWKSVATWYLWRSLDPVPVEY